MKKNSQMSPMMQQYLELKEHYKDCIVFYRLGDFYEMFDEDAKIASKELDIVLTGRDCGLDEKMPMCGVPFHAYEQYAQKLIERGYKVAICEQTDKMINKVMQREVVRIITPGTVIDSSMLDETKNSYILCLYTNKNVVSYAYGDMSTGELNVGEYKGDNIENYINDLIIKISPSEIICNSSTKELESKITCLVTNPYLKFYVYYDWAFNFQNAENNILKQYNLKSLKGFDFDTPNCVIVAGAMLEYFKETQKRELKHLKLPNLVKDNQYMYLDTNTRRNLEIELTMRNNSKHGSLFWVLDDTKTSAGSRQLRNWIRHPLQDKTEIEKRLSMVTALYNNPLIMADLRLSLSKIQDIERLAGKLAYGNINPKECLALADSLRRVPDIKNAIIVTENPNFLNLADKMIDVSDIVNVIDITINPVATSNTKDGGYIKEGFNESLDHLRNLRNNAEQTILEIQAREREATGIKNLKIGYNKVFGYYLEVNKQFSSLVPFNYVRKQTVSNNERYITEELKQFEEEILTSHEKALKLEETIFSVLKQQLMQNIVAMQQIANAISVVDCLYSLASVAISNDYVCPKITNNNTIDIKNGRHPIIEKINKTDFISNDCYLNNDDQRTMILTGPNMAGKSTFMRQVALITLMAHIGSFVPAESASICIVDRIFTRIGASDDLAVGQSTFMVEMIEVANILNFCTNNSLIILDEVGRGTSTFDGLSIAWSVVEYLAKKLNAKTLFATHYHELMQLEGRYGGVKNFCISIKEIGGKLVFLRKIMRGSATKSYGIEVASLAGLPNEIIDRAKELIVEFEQQKANDVDVKTSQIVNMLNELDINNLTPIAAFDTLSHLIDIAK